MRNGRDREKKRGKNGGERGGRGKNDENSGPYVIASNRPPERRPLERGMLVPICACLCGDR